VQSNANARGAEEFALVARRHNSLNSVTCWIVFGSLASVSLVIAVVFAMLGAWLILPFAGLEIAALALVLRWLRAHADDFERLSVSGEVVTLEVCEKNRLRRFEFNRAWARLVVRDRSWSTSLYLALRSHGREFEIGRYLDDGGRQALARELHGRLAGR
jgi:uncharacterized membrane protein